MPLARYNLIMKDETYFKLVAQATAQKKSMGRYLNDVLNEVANNAGDISGPPLCVECGRPATYEEFTDDARAYVCDSHRHTNIKGYKRLGGE